MKQKEHYVSMHFEPCTISTFSVFAVFSLHQSAGRCFILTTANSLPEKNLILSHWVLYTSTLLFFSHVWVLKGSAGIHTSPYSPDKFSVVIKKQQTEMTQTEICTISM